MRHSNKAIITCAVTGAAHIPCMSPYLPITPEQIADEAVAAAEAGAAIIHLHARDPENGMPVTDPDIYGQFLPRIKQRCDAIINITTGQPSHAETPEQVLNNRLAAPKKFAPEICSFNMGPMNPGMWALRDSFKGKTIYPWEDEFLAKGKDVTMTNTYATMERVARELGDERGVRFEYECFDFGHLYTLRFIADQGWVKPPFFIQTVFGFLGGLGADPMHLLHMKQTADSLFGNDYYWSVLAGGKNQMKMVAMASILGANVRVGLEDSLWYGPGQLAKSNADQVRRIRKIMEELSIEVATPDEARAMLETKGADRVNF
jgi:uncharacterized protein (DUF849 family)